MFLYVEKTQQEASGPDARPQSSFYEDLPFRGYKRPPTQVPICCIILSSSRIIPSLDN